MRTTIDYGIDLGTTNSAIAVLQGVTMEIIKNNADADITPSAVSIDKRGAVQVGQRAKNRIIDAPDDAYVEFKRRMGSEHVYHFKSSGQSHRPEDLSAEVLKSLRADVQQRRGESVEACVITVPAAFELHQCAATRKAAQLAGFKESPLLQEPVAAALACGFQADKQKAYWLVYDFGGGTFDAAIIKAEEGTIHVVNHGGDNFLGGSDIDWVIVEQVLAPRLLAEFPLPDFTRGNPAWRAVFAKLKRAAEIAKIDLSRGERATLESCKFANNGSGELEFECELTRAEVVKAAEPVIRRSVEICKRVLKEKNLSKEAIEKVILVGGPTLAPYFREMLASELGIPLDYSADPLTVVARGAAVFAGTQRLNLRAATPVAADEFSVDLKHKPVGMDSAPMVGGKISGAATKDFTGFILELVNPKTQWRSGKIAVRPDGVFMASLHAERGERNVFALELFDAGGQKRKVNPDSLTYTIGAVVEEQPLINSMGIALANNEYDRFFEKGRGLPLRTTRVYRTINSIRQGQSGELLKIPIIEGENEAGDRNRLIDYLKISATEIRRDLPANSEVEVTLSIDTSRLIRAKAYVPLLDEEFDATIDLKRSDPNPGLLSEECEAEVNRLQALRAKAREASGESADELLEELDASQLLQEIKQSLASAKGDPDAAAKCEKRLLELKLKLDATTDALEWPALVVRARNLETQVRSLLAQHSTPATERKGAELFGEVQQVIAEKRLERLRRKIEQMKGLYTEIVWENPSFWTGYFTHLEQHRRQMREAALAEQLLNQGRAFLDHNNLPGLRQVALQLQSLLPPDVLDAVDRGFQSGLVR